MHVAEWTARESLRLVERDAPKAGDGQVVVEVAGCGICGSDLKSYRDGFAARPGQVMGHEFAGTVVDAVGVRGIALGDRVTVRPLMPCGECSACQSGRPQQCRHAHLQDIGYAAAGAFAERVLVPRAVLGETVFHLPPEVSERAGALVEPLAVSLHAVRRAAPDPNAVVLVLGAGMIGLGVTRLLRLRGAGTIIVADLSPLRRGRALELGADIVVDPLTEDITQVARAETGPGVLGHGARVDVVIDCAGAVPAIAHALKSLRQGGVLVLAGLYGREVPLRIDRIVDKELDVRGSFAYADEFPAILRMLAAGELDPDQFISHTFDLRDIELAFRVQMDAERSLKVLVVPNGG